MLLLGIKGYVAKLNKITILLRIDTLTQKLAPKAFSDQLKIYNTNRIGLVPKKFIRHKFYTY